MKKDKPKSMSAAGKRIERKKQKEKGREVGKQHKQTEQFQSENRKLEHEFSQIAVNLALKNTAKMSKNPLLISKLSAINDVRMELDLMTKTMADQMQVIKDAKKEAKQILKAQKQKAAAPVYDDFKLDPQFDWQDLSYIEIPEGDAPETEGQIFKSLKQLRIIKQIPKRDKTATILPPSLPSLQPNSLSNSMTLPPPTLPVPIGSNVPAYIAPIAPPSFIIRRPLPSPFKFLVPPGIIAQNSLAPPPPPKFRPDLAPPPPPRFKPDFAVPPPTFNPISRPPDLTQRIPPPPPSRLAKHFPKTSQALKDGPVADPLNPEKDLDLTRKQEQSRSVITISAEPKLRDLQKELVHMVPASLLRNQVKK
jgi:hypothetical protein